MYWYQLDQKILDYLLKNILVNEEILYEKILIK
jgi:hypothetical protein